MAHHAKLYCRCGFHFLNSINTYTQLGNPNDDIGEQEARRHDSYNVFGARATWFPADANWSLAVWARNLFEEAYTINVGPGQPNINQLNFMYGPPLSYGVTFTYTL